MKSDNNLLQIILYAVCGLVCIGMGIFYFVTGQNMQGGIFTAVGVVSVALAVRFLVKYLKNRRDNDKKE